MESQVSDLEMLRQSPDTTQKISRDQDRLTQRLGQGFQSAGGVHNIAEIRNFVTLHANFSCDYRAAMQDSAELWHLTETSLPHRSLVIESGGEIEDTAQTG